MSTDLANYATEFLKFGHTKLEPLTALEEAIGKWVMWTVAS
jgi:hypothetical protein